MTFREYVDALFSTGLFGKNKGMFARALFKEAITKPNSEPSLEAIKSWMYGNNRHCDTSRYFTDGSVDKDHFIAYFRKHTRDPSSWKKIQAVFRQLELDEAFRVDLDTDDPDVFFWSLLNQFQRIFLLTESEREGREQGAPVTTAPQEEREPTTPATATQQELSPEQIRTMFFKAVHAYKIMDTINREPAILNWSDCADFNNFAELMMNLPGLSSNRKSNLLCMSIWTFSANLSCKTLSVDKALNKRFDFPDETASVNMEDDEDSIPDNVNPNPEGLLELTPEMISAAADPIRLLMIYDEDWGSFRIKMNSLFQSISSWQDKT